jgi:hypothetical protein
VNRDSGTASANGSGDFHEKAVKGKVVILFLVSDTSVCLVGS